MADYTIRIELHGVSREQYGPLHDAMFAIGATTTITGDDGRVHRLPPGEYNLVGSALSCTEVRDVAQHIAARFCQDPGVLVDEVLRRAWSLPVVSNSLVELSPLVRSLLTP